MKTTFAQDSYTFMQGGGEMGELTRRHHWEKTALGPPDTWSQSLRTTLGIVLHSAFPMFLFWGEELTCFYNDAFRPSLGNEGKHPALGKNAKEVWPEIWDFIGPLIQQVITTGEPVFFEDQLVPFYRNGRIENIYWTFSYSPVYGDEEKIGGVFVTCTETTRKMETIAVLEESKNQLAFAIEATELGVWDLNPQTNTFNANNRLKEWFGLQSAEQIKLQHALDVIVPRDKEKVQAAIATALQQSSGGKYDMEYGIIHPATKKARCVRARGQAWFNDEGVAYRFNGTLQDITEQVMTKNTRDAAATHFRSLIEEASVASCLFIGREMMIEVANKIMLGYWGKGESVIGKPLLEALPELKGQAFPEILDQVFTTGESYTATDAPAELVVNGKLQRFYFDYTYKALRNAEGDIYGVMDTAIDVTEKVLARERLEEAEERNRLSIEAGELGTFEVILQTNEVITSPRFNAIYGITGKVDRSQYIKAIHPDDLPLREAAYKKAFETGSLEYEARIFWQDGSLHWVRAKGKFTFDADHKPLKLFGVIQDITEEKLFFEKLEKLVQERTTEMQSANTELQRSNAYLEEFAYAASHDLKEPIRKIHFFTDRLKTQLSDRLSEEDKKMFEKVEHASKRMNLLIDDLLLYSHVSHRPHETEKIDLNDKIRKVLDDLELDIAEKQAVIKTGHLPVIRGYRRQLQQLFQNLISNALKYNRKGIPPQISITAELVNANVEGLVAGKAYHRIQVSDNGIGFEPEHAERIFQMFQRLHGKAEYEGTGVGLSIARKVTENHQGKLIATAVPGKGATFTVYLPADA